MIVYLYVLAAIVLRILPHPWNLTPMGALFLFSGANFRNKTLSIAVPLAALLISDYLVVRFVYHSFYSWLMTSPWPGFVLVAMVGWFLQRRVTWLRIAGASIAGSVVFFFASNFTVWLTGALYPVTTAGLISCFVQAIPFFKNTLLGDLLYSAVFLGSYELIRRYRQASNPVVAQQI